MQLSREEVTAAATMGMFKRRRLLRIIVIAAGFACLPFQTTLTSELTLIPSGASRGGEEESSSIKSTNTTFQQFSNPSYSGSYGRIAFRFHNSPTRPSILLENTILFRNISVKIPQYCLMRKVSLISKYRYPQISISYS